MNTNIHLLDLKAVALAKEYLSKEAEILSVLMEMRRQRVFIDLGYTGTYDYCVRRLNLSASQSFYFKSVAEKSEEVPELKQAVISGELTLSQARRIVPAVSKTNCQDWINKAKTVPQKDLEREVAAVNPRAHVQEKIKPVAKGLAELRALVDDETEADLERLKEILSQKTGKPATLGDVIKWNAKIALEKHDPIRKAERARAKAEKASKARPAATPKNTTPPRRPPGSSPTHPGEPSATAPRKHFLRNSQPLGKQQPGRTPLRASLKHAVMLRDRGQCTHVERTGHRCPQTRWLDHHHRVEVSLGGSNTLENLTLLCQAHHKLTHARK